MFARLIALAGGIDAQQYQAIKRAARPAPPPLTPQEWRSLIAADVADIWGAAKRLCVGLVWAIALLSTGLLFFVFVYPLLALIPFGAWVLVALFAANSGASREQRTINSAAAYLIYRNHQRGH
jgi:hypothetical protein